MYTLFKRKITKPLKNVSTICTTKITAQDNSDTRSNIYIYQTLEKNLDIYFYSLYCVSTIESTYVQNESTPYVLSSGVGVR